MELELDQIYRECFDECTSIDYVDRIETKKTELIKHIHHRYPEISYNLKLFDLEELESILLFENPRAIVRQEFSYEPPYYTDRTSNQAYNSYSFENPILSWVKDQKKILRSIKSENSYRFKFNSNYIPNSIDHKCEKRKLELIQILDTLPPEYDTIRKFIKENDLNSVSEYIRNNNYYKQTIRRILAVTTYKRAKDLCVSINFEDILRDFNIPRKNFTKYQNEIEENKVLKEVNIDLENGEISKAKSVLFKLKKIPDLKELFENGKFNAILYEIEHFLEFHPEINGYRTNVSELITFSSILIYNPERKKMSLVRSYYTNDDDIRALTAALIKISKSDTMISKTVEEFKENKNSEIDANETNEIMMIVEEDTLGDQLVQINDHSDYLEKTIQDNETEVLVTNSSEILIESNTKIISGQNKISIENDDNYTQELKKKSHLDLIDDLKFNESEIIPSILNLLKSYPKNRNIHLYHHSNELPKFLNYLQKNKEKLKINEFSLHDYNDLDGKKNQYFQEGENSIKSNNEFLMVMEPLDIISERKFQLAKNLALQKNMKLITWSHKINVDKNTNLITCETPSKYPELYRQIIFDYDDYERLEFHYGKRKKLFWVKWEFNQPTFIHDKYSHPSVYAGDIGSINRASIFDIFRFVKDEKIDQKKHIIIFENKNKFLDNAEQVKIYKNDLKILWGNLFNSNTEYDIKFIENQFFLDVRNILIFLRYLPPLSNYLFILPKLNSLLTATKYSKYLLNYNQQNANYYRSRLVNNLNKHVEISMKQAEIDLDRFLEKYDVTMQNDNAKEYFKNKMENINQKRMYKMQQIEDQLEELKQDFIQVNLIQEKEKLSYFDLIFHPDVIKLCQKHIDYDYYELTIQILELILSNSKLNIINRFKIPNPFSLLRNDIILKGKQMYKEDPLNYFIIKMNSEFCRKHFTYVENNYGDKKEISYLIYNGTNYDKKEDINIMDYFDILHYPKSIKKDPRKLHCMCIKCLKNQRSF